MAFPEIWGMVGHEAQTGMEDEDLGSILNRLMRRIDRCHLIFTDLWFASKPEIYGLRIIDSYRRPKLLGRMSLYIVKIGEGLSLLPKEVKARKLLTRLWLDAEYLVKALNRGDFSKISNAASEALKLLYFISGWSWCILSIEAGARSLPMPRGKSVCNLIPGLLRQADFEAGQSEPLVLALEYRRRFAQVERAVNAVRRRDFWRRLISPWNWRRRPRTQR